MEAANSSVPALQLTNAKLGALAVPAPLSPARTFDGLHGTLWQWVGDGQELISLAVSVREESRLASAWVVEGHLNWKLEELGATTPLETKVGAVPGALASASGRVSALREGVPTHSGVVVATEGANLYVVHVMVVDSDAGWELVSRVVDGIRIS